YELPDRPGHTTDRYSYPFYEQLREHARTIDVAAYEEGEAPVGAGEGASVARVVYASDGYWRSLGARPLLGRTFTDDEAHPVTGARVAVLGHGYWQRRFGGDTAAIGATMRIKG